MKFVQHKDEVRNVRGYVFWKGVPRDVTDHFTIELLTKDPDFQPYKEIERGEEAPQTQTPVLKSKNCPKCGKAVARGRYIHEKYCKGN